MKHLVWQKARSCKSKTQRKSSITYSAVLRRLCWVKDHYIIPLCVIYLIAPLSSVTVLLNKVERPLALFSRYCLLDKFKVVSFNDLRLSMLCNWPITDENFWERICLNGFVHQFVTVSGSLHIWWALTSLKFINFL